MDLRGKRLEDAVAGHELTLEYPCRWSYQVMGRDVERLRAALATAAGASEHVVRDGNRSSGGKYVSLHAEVLVRDERERRRVFAALREHADVAFVL